jgi:hypothetical protein
MIPEDVLSFLHGETSESRAGSQSKAPARGATPVLTCLADVEPTAIRWLWKDRIPRGRLTLLVGRPGEGKSFVTCDLAARISNGTRFPDGADCEAGSVLLLTAEDDPADTIRPRLDAAGADCSRIHLLSAIRSSDDDGEHERPVSLHHIDLIEQAIQRVPDCRLIVIDPIGSYLGGSTDAHRDNEVRAVLAPLAALASQYDVAVLIVMHTRKSRSEHADDAALGSRAFTGLARAVWHLAADPEDSERRLMLPGKNNLTRRQSGLACRIVGDGQQACLEWSSDPVDLHADDVIGERSGSKKPGPLPAKQAEAANWLQQALARGPRMAKDLFREWEADGGSVETLKRSKKLAGVQSCRESSNGPWLWRLHPIFSGGQVVPELEHLDDLDPLGAELDSLGDQHQEEMI